MAAPKGNKYAVKHGELATEVMQCRMTPSDKKLFHDKAKAEGLPTCSWMRITLKREANG